MRIAIGSDIHLEFGDFKIKNIQNADVLVLAGDITTVKHIDDHIGFFRQCSQQFQYVIYVLGNHEHYHGNFFDTKNEIAEKLKQFDNIYVFERGRVFFEDLNTVFLVGTMWTDINKGNPVIIEYIKRAMNDFYIIENIDVLSTINAHNSFLNCVHEYIEEYREKEMTHNVVVVSHHAPSFLSVHEKYKNLNNMTLNYAFASNDEEFIINHPEISFWIHGHMHDPFDYTLGETNVICNPRGYYMHESQSIGYDLKYIEL